MSGEFLKRADGVHLAIELAADEGSQELEHGADPEGGVDQVEVLELLAESEGQEQLPSQDTSASHDRVLGEYGHTPWAHLRSIIL